MSKPQTKYSAARTTAAAVSATATSLSKVKRNVANQMESQMQNATDQMEKVSSQFTSKLEEAASFSRNNVEACVQAASIMAEGVKDMNAALVAAMQNAMQTAMSTSKAMLGVKTLRDLMELQSSYMKSCMDTLMSESTRMSELAVKTTTNAAEPINARVSDVVEKISDRTKHAA